MLYFFDIDKTALNVISDLVNLWFGFNSDWFVEWYFMNLAYISVVSKWKVSISIQFVGCWKITCNYFFQTNIEKYIYFLIGLYIRDFGNWYGR